MTKRRPRPQRKTPSVFGRGSLTASLVVVFPLFLSYELLVLFSSTMNGVDFVSRTMISLVDGNRVHYALIHLGIGLLVLGYVLYQRKRNRGIRISVLSLIVESLIYALLLGTTIRLFMIYVLGFEASAADSSLALGRIGESIVTSLGAGVHEELVFRLGVMTGLAAILRRFHVGHSSSVLVGLVISSVLFSAAHHIGPFGDPFSSDVFVYRVLAGASFGAIYYFRSLAHAVYSHVLYDLYVFIVLA